MTSPRIYSARTWCGFSEAVSRVLLAMWRLHGVDTALRTACRRAWCSPASQLDQSAGMLAGRRTRSGPQLRAVTDGLGFVPYANGVHYDSEGSTPATVAQVGRPGGVARSVCHRRRCGRAVSRHRVRECSCREQQCRRLFRRSSGWHGRRDTARHPKAVSKESLGPYVQQVWPNSVCIQALCGSANAGLYYRWICCSHDKKFWIGGPCLTYRTRLPGLNEQGNSPRNCPTLFKNGRRVVGFK